MSYQLTADEGVAIFRMDHGKANSLTPGVLEDWQGVFEDLATDDSIDACVITGNDRMFSAGFDLSVLAGMDALGIERALTALAELAITLYGWPKPLVAHLSGHAIAGGAILALTADLRVAESGKARFGLNEIELALPLPSLVVEMLRGQVGERIAWQVAREGRLLPMATAAELGLVEVVVTGSQERARAEARFLAGKEPTAYATTKSYVRGAALARMQASLPTSREHFTAAFVGPARERLQAALDKLGNR